MWNVIAPVVRWPLYSPGRLAAIVLVALAAVIVAGELNGDDVAPAAAPSSSASASPASTDPASSSSSASASPASTDPATEETPALVEGGHTDALSGDPAEVNPSAAAADAAAAFVAAWARPDLSAEAWAAGVKPLATPEAWADGLSETDPANTPDVAVRGEPVQAAINAEEGILDVPTTGEWYRVLLSYDAEEDAWLVSGVESLA